MAVKRSPQEVQKLVLTGRQAERAVREVIFERARRAVETIVRDVQHDHRARQAARAAEVHDHLGRPPGLAFLVAREGHQHVFRQVIREHEFEDERVGDRIVERAEQLHGVLERLVKVFCVCRVGVARYQDGMVGGRRTGPSVEAEERARRCERPLGLCLAEHAVDGIQPRGVEKSLAIVAAGDVDAIEDWHDRGLGGVELRDDRCGPGRQRRDSLEVEQVGECGAVGDRALAEHGDGVAVGLVFILKAPRHEVDDGVGQHAKPVDECPQGGNLLASWQGVSSVPEDFLPGMRAAVVRGEPVDEAPWHDGHVAGGHRREANLDALGRERVSLVAEAGIPLGTPQLLGRPLGHEPGAITLVGHLHVVRPAARPAVVEGHCPHGEHADGIERIAADAEVIA